MRRRRLEILLIGLTVLALAAGVVAGVLASRIPAAASVPAPSERTPLAEELGLTSDQREQMRQIWEAVRVKVHDTFDDAQRLQKQRDDALVALLNDEQKAQFENISKDYAQQYSELQKKRDQTFQDAVEQTMRLLDETQRRKYEEILRTRVPSGLTPGGPAIVPPTSLPATTKPAT